MDQGARMVEPAVALLFDAFGRVDEVVAEVTEDLSDAVACYRPTADANSISWLVWHLSRVQDDHIADAAGRGQVWPRWRDRFALPFDNGATGYGQSSEDVGRVQVGAPLLLGYHRDVSRQTMEYLQELTPQELERVIDTRWDPPVTVGVRLVSVLSDCLQHLGQAAYIRGLANAALEPAPASDRG